MAGMAGAYPLGMWALSQGRILSVALVFVYVVAFAYTLIWLRSRSERSEIDQSPMRRIGTMLEAGRLAGIGWHKVLVEHAAVWIVALAAGYGVATKNYVLVALATVGWWLVDDRLSRFMLLRSYGLRIPAGYKPPPPPEEPHVEQIGDAVAERLRAVHMEKAPLHQTWVAELNLLDADLKPVLLPSQQWYADWRSAVCREERIVFTQLVSRGGAMRDNYYEYLLAIDQDVITVAWSDGRARIVRSIVSRKYPEDLLRSLADQGARLVTHDRLPFVWR